MNKMLVIGLAAMMAGCNNAAKVQNLVANHFDALNHHNINELVADYQAGAKLNPSGWESPKTGPAAIREAYSRYFNTTEDLKYKITHAIYSDTTAVVEYESSGSIPVDDPSVPLYMAGKKFSLQNCVVMHIKDDKITTESIYFDQVSFLRQVGFFDQTASLKH